MLDTVAHQAAGLIGLASSATIQLVALVRQGDVALEQRALDTLCTGLSGLGYSVTVLEAELHESASAPGLQQLMEFRLGCPAQDNGADTVSWLPAALGLAALPPAAPAAPTLQAIAHLFAPGSVLVLCAQADRLVELLAGQAVQPLVCAGPQPHSQLGAYQALKRLLLNGRLDPLILHMIDTAHTGAPAAASRNAAPLGTCAKNFLGYEAEVITMDIGRDRPPQAALGRQLAIRLLEGALSLDAAAAPARRGRAAVLQAFYQDCTP